MSEFDNGVTSCRFIVDEAFTSKYKHKPCELSKNASDYKGLGDAVRRFN